jgi:hypothetical protein
MTDRQERDELVDRVFQTAQLPLIHVPCRSGYEVEEIRRLVEEGMRGSAIENTQGGAGASQSIPISKPTPNTDRTEAVGKALVCPKCGVRMVKREGARGVFWGCPNFPKCRHTMAGEEGK